MFGKFGDMMGKLQEMKQRADELKRKMDETILTAEGAGGDIKIEITGNREIKKLSIAERLAIVEDIWDSIVDSKEEFPLTDEQKKELDSRLEAYQNNPDGGKTWEEVKRNIQSRL